jgi:hypothetical protein
VRRVHCRDLAQINYYQASQRVAGLRLICIVHRDPLQLCQERAEWADSTRRGPCSYASLLLNRRGAVLVVALLGGVKQVRRQRLVKSRHKREGAVKEGESVGDVMVIATVPGLRAGASLRTPPLRATCPSPVLCQGRDDECLLSEAYQQDGGLRTNERVARLADSLVGRKVNVRV